MSTRVTRVFRRPSSPRSSLARLRQLPGRPSRRRATARRWRSTAYNSLWRDCRCLSCFASPPHGGASPTDVRWLHRPKSTAMTARRCAPPRSSPSRTYAAGTDRMMHGARCLSTDVREAAARAGHLKPRQCLYHPLLVILQKHLRKGNWTGRTITTKRSQLLVVGGKLRIPWLFYWQGSLTQASSSKQKLWRLSCKTCQHRMMLITLQSWQWQRQWR